MVPPRENSNTSITMKQQPTGIKAASSASSEGEIKNGFSSQRDPLTRIFNTALISTRYRGGKERDFPTELLHLTESAAFKTILLAVHQHAQIQGIPEKQASEEVIQTFRTLDELWTAYIFKEGLDKIRGQRN